VLSGGTQREDLKRYAYRPDFILESIADLCDEEVYGRVTAAVEAEEQPAAA
jgi:hypothetical protein